MGKGYAAIENMLFYKPNCGMFFGSAQVKVNEVLAQLAEVFIFLIKYIKFYFIYIIILNN